MELRCHLALGIGLIVPRVHRTKLTVRLSLFSGEIHLDNQHAHRARGSYTRALELARQRTQTDRVIAAHLGLGAALMRTAANEALQILREALRLALLANNNPSICRAHLLIGA